MMKKWISIVLCLLLFGSLSLTVSAAQLPLVIDQAGLLEESEVQALTEEALELYESYRVHAVILTVDSLNGASSQTYADDYYEQNGYSDDGVLFLLAMEEREWYISTSGKAIYALTDYALYEMENDLLSDLQNGDYCGAFYTFLWDVDYYMDAYCAGNTVDGYIPEEDRYDNHTEVVYEDQGSDVGSSILMGCGVGLVAAVITILVMRSSMNTKRMQYSAGDYLKANSFRLYKHQDLFLYSQVSKRRKPENNGTSRPGGGGGGSSVHRSSGGSSHGGRGGRF